MKAWGIVMLLAMLLIGASTAGAQSPTNTPTETPAETLTPSPTLNSAQRAALATIVPPPSCGAPYNPCGALPWSVPKFPTVALASPTIKPTLPSPTPIPMSATPSQTITPTGTWSSPTPTAASTMLGGMDIGSIATFTGQIGGMSSTLSAQGLDTISVNGTPVGMGDTLGRMGGQIGGTFGAISAIASLMRQLGTVGSLIMFLFIALLVVAMVKIGGMFVPLIINLLRFVLQVIQTVKPF